MSNKQIFSAGFVILVFLYFFVFLTTFMYVKYKLLEDKRPRTVTEIRAERKRLILLFIISTIPGLNMLLIPYCTIVNFIGMCKGLYQMFMKTMKELFRPYSE